MSSTPRETPGDASAASGSASRPGAEVRFDQVAPLPANPGPARKTEQGTLYLIPVPLGPDQDPRENLPPATLAVIAGLECFIVENAKSARAVLRRLPLACPLQSIEMSELNEHTPAERWPALLAPLLAGRSVGLMSDAGCPAVADPGGAVVALAHRQGIRVVPLVGPSSLLLALMASGMNGQSFSFVGYLPVAAPERVARIQALERRAGAESQTQIVIETPYRNQALFEALIEVLAPDTLVGVATDLTLPGERIRVSSVVQWRQAAHSLPRTPTVFTLARPPGPQGGSRPASRPAPRAAVSATSGSPRRR